MKKTYTESEMKRIRKLLAAICKSDLSAPQAKRVTTTGVPDPQKCKWGSYMYPPYEVDVDDMPGNR